MTTPNAKTGPMPVDEAIRTMNEYSRFICGELMTMPTTCTKARRVRAIASLVKVAELARCAHTQGRPVTE